MSASVARFPSLELRSFSERIASQELPCPLVVYSFEKGIDWGGLHHPPGDGEYFCDGRWFDNKNGIIVVNGNTKNDIGTTLAHEWRHHWQKFNTKDMAQRYDGIGLSSENYNTYGEFIVDYFTKSSYEMDALLFQNKHCPDEWSLQMLDWVRASLSGDVRGTLLCS